MPNISNDNLYYVSSLDPVNQRQQNEEEIIRMKDILKLSSLFSENIFLSDSQVVANKGIKDLFLSDENFQDFFCDSVYVGMRNDESTKPSSFSEIVDIQIQNKAIYPSLPSKVQEQINHGDIKNLDHLNRKYPALKIGPFLKILDHKYNFKNIKRINYGKNYDLFPKKVEENLQKLEESNYLINPDVKKLCNELISIASTEQKSKESHNISRSIFYSAIDKTHYSEEVKTAVKKQ